MLPYLERLKKRVYVANQSLQPVSNTQVKIVFISLVLAFELFLLRWLNVVSHVHISTLRSRKALLITETELKLMAAAAIMGDNNRPKTGYKSPAAIGTPIAL